MGLLNQSKQHGVSLTHFVLAWIQKSSFISGISFWSMQSWDTDYLHLLKLWWDIFDITCVSLSLAFQFFHITVMCLRAQLLSCVRLFETTWIIAHQDLLSIGFSRQEYWSGLPWPAPGDLPDPGIKSASPALALTHLGSHRLWSVELRCKGNFVQNT